VTTESAYVTDQRPLARLLAANPFFGGLGREALETIAALCTTRTLARGEVLFLKGDPGDALYAIRRGRIRIATGTDEGRHVTLNILGPGDVFGEIALLDGKPRTAEAVAIEPCDIYAVQRRDFLPLLQRDLELAIRVIELLCARLRWVSDRMEDAALLPMEARLARALLMLAEDYGSDVQISQQELADLVGASRERVNRQLRAWQHEALIALRRSRIVIMAADSLLERASYETQLGD
jgi:CRP/FNR family transcriptional regulator, cyclic AMP receptor protein